MVYQCQCSYNVSKTRLGRYKKLANYFSIIYSEKDRLKYEHVENLDLGILLKLTRKHHVYYQVLPLAERPKRGRGSAQHVKKARWLFADLDYKEEVHTDQRGCVERADHELECYYEESGRVYRAKRPPLGEVLKSVKEKTGLTPAIVVDSGAGYHLYFELEKEIEDMSLWRRLES